jgi:SpoVK/Ycf46/Vps4 family AAA+-type ATPase
LQSVLSSVSMSSPKTPQSDKRARQKGNLTPKLSDKRLMPRIKEYLSTVHSSRKKHMSAEDIALALQEQYYDYARKKRRPFVQQVEEVCEWLRSKRSEEKISQLENKHLARKYHSQAKQTQQIDNEGSESSTSRGVSTDSEADFEVEFKENPQLQKSANLMNTALQAVYQSKGNVPTPTNSSTGDGSLPCSTSERAQFDSLGSDYPNQTGEPSCEATSTNGHPVLEGHWTTTAVLQGKGTPLSTAVRTGMEEGPFEEVVPVEGSLSESPLQQTVLDKRTAIATPQLPASHVTSIRGNSPRTSLGTLPVDTPGDFAGNSPLNLSMSGFNEQETPTAKEGLVQSCSSLLKSEDQRNSSIICSSRKRRVEEGDKDGADSKIRQKRKKIKDPIVAGQSVGKASSERPQDPDFIPVKSSVRFSDVGGNDDTLKEVCKLLLHLRHPEIYRQLGVSPPQGFLLIGPPGCGKSLLANAIAGELDLPYFRVAATEVVSGISGESEEKLRRLFQVAKESAPCVVFLDEIDAISPKRDTAQREMERRIVSQLLSCMDELSSDCNSGVLVIGATNRPDSIDPALRRAGRFDREVWLGIPNQKAREKILSVLCRGLKLSDEVTLKKLAELSPGFVGADLMALTREAAVHAVERIVTQMSTNRIETTPMGICDVDGPGEGVLSSGSDGKELDEIMRILHTPTAVVPETLDNLSISFDDFQSALVHVQPSAKREGFATVPDVSWEDVGALDNVREELKMAILAPVQFSDQFEALGLSNSPGILLAGPPGCGKTLLAKAIANESRINFLSVKGPELLNMVCVCVWVGVNSMHVCMYGICMDMCTCVCTHFLM